MLFFELIQVQGKHGIINEPYIHPDTLPQKVSESLSSKIPKTAKTPCQPIIAAWDTLQIIPLPADTGNFLYIPLCLGDSVFFKLFGTYPQNGQFYTQHDTLATYTWDFGDGSRTTTNTPSLWHRYDSARGFEMNVYITDTNQCISNPLVARVLVTQSPVNTVNPIPSICQGDTTLVTPSTFINYVPYSYSQVSSQKFDSTMFVPDGPNCNPTHPCYNTEVIFTSFLPTQTITSSSDIQSVCVLMEHSYVGDLSFVIKCPNGQTDTLKKYIHWGGADMGIAGTPDNGCDPRNNPPGTPWNYCWSTIFPTIGTINANAGKARLDSTDIINNLNYYDPDNPFLISSDAPSTVSGVLKFATIGQWITDIFSNGP
ncbi:MAG: PKD domain-containing protein [Bacteroidales bacterium]